MLMVFDPNLCEVSKLESEIPQLEGQLASWEQLDNTIYLCKSVEYIYLNCIDLHLPTILQRGMVVVNLLLFPDTSVDRIKSDWYPHRVSAFKAEIGIPNRRHRGTRMQADAKAAYHKTTW